MILKHFHMECKRIEKEAMLALLLQPITYDTQYKGDWWGAVHLYQRHQRETQYLHTRRGGKCDWARAECRVAGNERNLHFKCRRMFSIRCLWNTAAGTTNVRDTPSKPRWEKKKKKHNSAALEFTAEHNLALLSSRSWRGLIWLQSTAARPCSSSLPSCGLVISGVWSTRG